MTQAPCGLPMKQVKFRKALRRYTALTDLIYKLDSLIRARLTEGRWRDRVFTQTDWALWAAQMARELGYWPAENSLVAGSSQLTPNWLSQLLYDSSSQAWCRGVLGLEVSKGRERACPVHG